MQANKTVTINGRVYDAVTGLPIEKKSAARTAPVAKPSEVKRAAQVAATTVHTTTQRSQTLHRRVAKKPGLAKRPQPGRHMDIARSGQVTRFAAHPKVEATAPKPSAAPDIKPKTHPVAARAQAKVVARQPKPVAATPKQIKDQAIEAALAKASSKPVKQSRAWKLSRRFTIISAVFFVLILGAYLTYMNMPSLSVSFASAQAGIQATYPEYRPDGYRLEQPVTYEDGEVTLTFKSNSTDGGYVVTQEESSWDSSAVLNNVVRATAGDNYVTTQERGLTIYSYDDKTVWVNGGILYTITSDAPLSGEQIRRIATSL